MITPLNTALIGIGRLPTCRTCDEIVDLTACDIEKGKRLRRPSHPALRTHDDYIVLYKTGDASSVECTGCCSTQWCGDQHTPIDARYSVFVDSGNVYARIIRGRHDQILIVKAVVTLLSGKQVSVSRTVSIYTRPYVSDCLQRGRDYTRNPQPISRP